MDRIIPYADRAAELERVDACVANDLRMLAVQIGLPLAKDAASKKYVAAMLDRLERDKPALASVGEATTAESCAVFAPLGNAAGGACPDASFSNTSNMTINRATLQWSLAAAAYAYGFGRLSELGYLYVTADQLVAGPWPDNCPFVASLDWQSGEPNAKFWIVRMLAAALGKRERTLMPTAVSNNATAYALGMQMAGTEQRVLLLVSKTSKLQTFDVGFAKGWRGAVL